MKPRAHLSEPPASPAATMAGMGACYALGTFTDNCYKQAAVFMAAAAQMADMQSLATVLFSLPFILFSAWAGWLSDRIAKKDIIIAAKSLELAAMLAGAWLLLTADWPGILAVMFLMAAQSTLFSPAINGSIPENFAPHDVPRVNALIKLVSTVAILAGAALAGCLLDARPSFLTGLVAGLYPDAPGEQQAALGRGAVGTALVAVSFLGLLAAFALRRKQAADKNGKSAFPWLGPLDSVRHASRCRNDKALWLALLADAWFYGIAVVAIISIANMAAALEYGTTAAGLMTAALSIGVALGALLAGRCGPESWRAILMPAAWGMGIMLMLTACSPLVTKALHLQTVWIFLCLFCCGLAGGIYLIPLESFIQVRPAPAEKGKVIAVSNFMSFSAMLLFGAAFQYIGRLAPALTFALYGAGTLLFAVFFCQSRLRLLPAESGTLRQAGDSALAFLLRALLSLRYKVTEKGLDALPAASAAGGPPAPGILFLPNHPALIDPVLVYSRIAGLQPMPLADARNMRGPLPWLAKRLVPTITIADMQKDGRQGARSVRLGIGRAAQALQEGRNVLLYPSGHLMSADTEKIGANSAVARILAMVPGARVVLVRSSGVWGSSFSRASGKKPRFAAALLRGMAALALNGIFFTPRRKVVINFTEPDDLPRGAHKLELNRYLEAYYNDGSHAPQSVPYFFRQKTGRNAAEGPRRAPPEKPPR